MRKTKKKDEEMMKTKKKKYEIDIVIGSFNYGFYSPFFCFVFTLFVFAKWPAQSNREL